MFLKILFPILLSATIIINSLQALQQLPFALLNLFSVGILLYKIAQPSISEIRIDKKSDVSTHTIDLNKKIFRDFSTQTIKIETTNNTTQSTTTSTNNSTQTKTHLTNNSTQTDTIPSRTMSPTAKISNETGLEDHGNVDLYSNQSPSPNNILKPESNPTKNPKTAMKNIKNQ